MGLRQYYNLNQGINIKEFEERLKEELPFSLDESKFEEESVTLIAKEIVSDSFDDTVYCSITAVEGGSFGIELTFDRFKKVDMKVYELINEFNLNVSFFTAYIVPDEAGSFLRVSYSAYEPVNTDEAVESVKFAFDNLLSEHILEYLTPLTKMTKGE